MNLILAAAEQSGLMGTLTMVVPLLLIFVAMYFLVIKPQKKEQNRVKNMLAELEPGDSVLTSSGFYGVVLDVDDDTVVVEFGNNKNCRIPMQKSAIVQIEKPGAEA